MRIGKLRHLVTIQQRVAGSPDQTAEGAPDEDWASYATDVWAAVEPLSGRELFAAQQFESEVTTRVRIRYRSGITAAMRVVFESRNYNIRYILDPDERHIELHLLCTQGVNAG
jgi:SPP1 family predicted phage head-tail adaptor